VRLQHASPTNEVGGQALILGRLSSSEQTFTRVHEEHRHSLVQSHGHVPDLKERQRVSRDLLHSAGDELC
jgi:hypothetical protein